MDSERGPAVDVVPLGGLGEFGRAATRAREVLDWPAARLTAAAFAVVGDAPVMSAKLVTCSAPGAYRTVDLFEEAIDLAIRITDAPAPGLAGRPLQRIRHLACASPRYLATHGTPRHPQDLAQHSCLSLGEDERDRHWRFQRGADTLSVKVRGRYVANHSEVRLEGALHALGIASLPEFTARASLATGELVTVLEDWEHLTDYSGMAWLLYPPNRFLASKLRVWIDHVVAGLERMPS